MINPIKEIVYKIYRKGFNCANSDQYTPPEYFEQQAQEIRDAEWTEVVEGDESTLPEPDATRIIDGKRHDIYYLTDGKYGPTVVLYRFHELEGLWWDDCGEGIEGVTHWQPITPPRGQ